MKDEKSAEVAHQTTGLPLPDELTYSEDGVDLTLIRWMLSLTPEERLRTLEQTVRSIMRLRADQTET